MLKYLIAILCMVTMINLVQSIVQTCYSGTLHPGSSMMQPVETMCSSGANDACLVNLFLSISRFNLLKYNLLINRIK